MLKRNLNHLYEILLEFAALFHDMCEDDDSISKLFSKIKLK